MRHRKSGVKLSRTSEHRKAMFRNMVGSLFEFKQIKTTTPKAKELRSWADKIISLAKQGDLHSRRQALAIIHDKNIVHKLFETVNEQFGHINSGYTQIFKIGIRKGDTAPMSLVKLYEKEAEQKKSPKKDEKFLKEDDLKKTEVIDVKAEEVKTDEPAETPVEAKSENEELKTEEKPEEETKPEEVENKESEEEKKDK